jgi:hypothetical protein
MKRLQISLEPELDHDLERAAATAGVSKAEIVRRALRVELSPPPVVALPVSSGDGGLMPGVDLADGRALRAIMDGVDE